MFTFKGTISPWFSVFTVSFLSASLPDSNLCRVTYDNWKTAPAFCRLNDVQIQSRWSLEPDPGKLRFREQPWADILCCPWMQTSSEIIAVNGKSYTGWRAFVTPTVLNSLNNEHSTKCMSFFLFFFLYCICHSYMFGMFETHWATWVSWAPLMG